MPPRRSAFSGAREGTAALCSAAGDSMCTTMVSSTVWRRWRSLLCLLLLAACSAAPAAAGKGKGKSKKYFEFGTEVVKMKSPKDFRQLEKSDYLWIVAFYRESCGCRALPIALSRACPLLLPRADARPLRCAVLRRAAPCCHCRRRCFVLPPLLATTLHCCLRFCALLRPEWEAAATDLKRYVKVAAVDVEGTQAERDLAG